MMDIRNDFFPEVETLKAQEVLEGFVYLTYSSLNGIFPTEDDIIKYTNNFENPQIAKLFLETGRYYHFAKNYSCPTCYPPKHLEKCPNCQELLELPSFLVLIMIISIMERLSSGLKPYKDFYNWIGKKETRKKVKAFLETSESKNADELISSLTTEWLKEYGSSTKITEFFSKFLTKEEKMEFVKSIRYSIEVPELPPKMLADIEGKSADEMTEIFDGWKETFEKEQSLKFQSDADVLEYIKKNNNKMSWEALPICFDEKDFLQCYSRDFYGHGQGYCHYNYLCKLDNDTKVLDECFEKTVKTIYDWRSKFVHDMKIPPINETAIMGDFYNNKSVIVTLTTKELKPVFERMIKRYFDQFQTKV